MSIVFLLEVGFGFSFNFVSYGCGFFYIEFHKVLEIHMWMRDSLSLEVSPAAGKHPFSSASCDTLSFSILLISLTRPASFF